MSLLMDALKKAEEEKKLAAKRLQNVEMDARETSGENEVVDNNEPFHKEEKDEGVKEPYLDTSKFSLEPLSLTENIEETVEAPIENEVVEQWEVETVDATEAFSEDLTLENTINEEINSDTSFEETQKEIDLNDTTIIEGLSAESSSAPFDDTFHGVVFEDEEPETDVYEETLPGVPADQLAKDLGGGQFQPTPVAAQTVFSVGRPVKKESSFKWGIFVILGLLAIGSFSIFYYFTITPVSRELPSPVIARGIESSGVESPVIVPTLDTQAVDTDDVTEVVIESTETLQPELANNSEVRSIDDNTVNIEDVVAQVEDTANVEEQTGDPIILTETPEYNLEEVEAVTDNIGAVVEDDESIDSFIFNEVTTDGESIDNDDTLVTETNYVPVDTSLISISKADKQHQENVMLAQAFKAYQNGQYSSSKSLYEDVLKSEPDNRDAHLGLGAIAIRQSDRKNAYSHYVHLVELNPLDTIAMSSLIALSNSADPVKDESAIKSLIQRDDRVPYLHFLLGNLFAKQKRWTSAQQAFFDAYRLDTTNPDYVFNLAVSLDQLGQYDTALDFYTTAIDLSQNTSSRFDPVSVNQRIIVLSKLIESKS